MTERQTNSAKLPEAIRILTEGDRDAVANSAVGCVRVEIHYHGGNSKSVKLFTEMVKA